MTAEWAGIGLTALLAALAGVVFVVKDHSRSQEHANDIKQLRDDLDQERLVRERADREARKDVEEALHAATVHSDKLLVEIKAELQHHRNMLMTLMEQVAKNEGRREVFERLVEKLIDKE